MSKEGFAPFDGTINVTVLNLVLDPIATVPDNMIRVPRSRTTIEGVSSDVAAFWMDRFEVSNRQFKASMPSQIHDVMREILDWFDRFLGAVNTGAR